MSSTTVNTTTAGTTTVNGVTIHYQVEGEGTPLLLIMGLGAQLTAWPQPFVDALIAEGFQVIRFDNRDCGLSSKMTGAPMSVRRQVGATIFRRFARAEYLLWNMADDAAGVLDAVGVDGAHVVGASMGGMIAQCVAIRHPKRTVSLTSIMSTTGNPKVGRVAPRLLARAGRLIKTDEATFVDRQVELFRIIEGSSYNEADTRAAITTAYERSYCPDGTARQLAAIMASGDRTTSLGTLTIPALVVHGLEDPLVQPSGGIATAEAIPGARLLMFPDMGHNLPVSRRGELAGAIADLARLTSQPPTPMSSPTSAFERV
jgi:pimeloyl-ACP methyl ester carboxylesterase